LLLLFVIIIGLIFKMSRGDLNPLRLLHDTPAATVIGNVPMKSEHLGILIFYC